MPAKTKTIKKRRTPTPIIRTKTITAKDLLLKIRQVVLAEPRRADLGYWVVSLNGKEIVKVKERRAKPACGTIACLAGWGAVLLRPNNANLQTLNQRAGSVLELILGTFNPPLFDAEPKWEFGETFESYGRPGTKKHANTVANRIDMYLAENEDRLSRRVVDVASVRQALKGEIWPDQIKITEAK